MPFGTWRLVLPQQEPRYSRLVLPHLNDWPGLVTLTSPFTVPDSGGVSSRLAVLDSGGVSSQRRQIRRCTGISRGMSRSPGMNGTSSSKIVARPDQVRHRNREDRPMQEGARLVHVDGQ